MVLYEENVGVSGCFVLQIWSTIERSLGDSGLGR
jgi:hypothetical protein